MPHKKSQSFSQAEKIIDPIPTLGLHGMDCSKWTKLIG